MVRAQRQQGVLFQFFDVLVNIVVIVAVVVGIRTFLVSPFQVEGNSMVGTLEDKEYIIINKLVYFVSHPQRGDVVVFFPPHEDHEKYYVKRIIGTPGDEVVIKNGNVYVRTASGSTLEKLPEPYLDEQNAGKTFAQPHGGSDREVRYTVPKDRYFVLGDNRQGSLDSRSFVTQREQAVPFVPEESIKGKVWFVALPVSKIHALEPPEYGL